MARRVCAALAVSSLAACQPQSVAAPEAPVAAAPASPARPARVSADDVGFTIADLPAGWDGQETAGGLWVALPWPPTYRRVLVRDPETGRAVVAKLYWRDPAPGADQALLSAAAAKALGAAAGATAPLTFTVLKAE